MIDLNLSLKGFFLYYFEQIFNFVNKSVDLLILLNLILSNSFFKALIKIHQIKIVSWFIQKLQSLILRLFEKSSNFLELILESDILKFGSIFIGIYIEKESEFIRTWGSINVSIDFFKNLFFKFLFLWKFWLRWLMFLLCFFFKSSFQSIQIWFNMPIILFIIKMNSTHRFWFFQSILGTWRLILDDLIKNIYTVIFLGVSGILFIYRLFMQKWQVVLSFIAFRIVWFIWNA